MKPFNAIIILLLFLFLGSCLQEVKYSEKKPAFVTGKIHQYNGENSALSLIYSQPGVNESTELIKIDSTGNFSFTIEGHLPLDAMLLEQNTFANIYFIYHPGDSVHLEFEAKDKGMALLKTVKYSGSRAETNNSISDFQVLRETQNLGYAAIDKAIAYKKNATDFILEMDELKERQLKLYSSFIKESTPNEEAKNWIALYALESYYHFLDEYSWNHQDLPEAYFDYNYEILPLSEDKLLSWHVLEKRITSNLQADLFSKFAKQYPGIDLIPALTDKTSKSDSSFVQFASEMYTDNLLLQLSLSSLYKSLFSINSLESYQRNQVALEKTLTTPYIINPLQETYNKTQETLNSPEERTALVLKEMIGSPIEETFKTILEENKGKVIFLDFWATWCKPCIEEMPDSKLLLSKFGQQGVAFVYVCTDENKEKRDNLLSTFGLESGQHYQLDSKQAPSLFDVFQFNGIPYHMLIDKNGSIIERGNHLSPSMKSTEEKIVALLNKS